MNSRSRASNDATAKNAANSTDVHCLNDNILRIDLDELEIETLDQRIELALATLFGEAGAEGAGNLQVGCGQFTCTGYWPE